MKILFIFVFILCPKLLLAQFIYPVDFHERESYYHKIEPVVDDPNAFSTTQEITYWTIAKNLFFFESYKTRAVEYANQLVAARAHTDIKLFFYEMDKGIRPYCYDPYGPRHFSQFLEEYYVVGSAVIQNKHLPITDFYLRAAEYQIKCRENSEAFFGANGGMALLQWTELSSGERKESIFRSYSNSGIFIYSDLFRNSDFDTLYVTANHHVIDQFLFPVPLYSDLSIPVKDAPGFGGGPATTKNGVQLIVQAGHKGAPIKSIVNGFSSLENALRKIDNFSFLANKFRFPKYFIEWIPRFKMPIQFKNHVETFKIHWSLPNNFISGAHTQSAFLKSIEAIKSDYRVVEMTLSKKIPLKGFELDGIPFAFTQDYVVKDKFGQIIKGTKTYFDTDALPLSDVYDLLMIAANGLYKKAAETGAEAGKHIYIEVGKMRFGGFYDYYQSINGNMFSTIYPL